MAISNSMQCQQSQYWQMSFGRPTDFKGPTTGRITVTTSQHFILRFYRCLTALYQQMHQGATPTVFTFPLYRKQEKNVCYECGLRHEATDCHLPYPCSQEPSNTFLNPACSKLKKKTVFTFGSITIQRAELWLEKGLRLHQA